MRGELFTSCESMKHQAHILAILLFSGLALCSHGTSVSTGKWDLVSSDVVSDGVPILALHFHDKNDGFALTPSELAILADQGNKWTTILSNPNGDRAFYSLVFVKRNTGFIVGAQKRSDGFAPLILQTADGGTTWEDRYVDVPSVKNIHTPHSLNAITFCGGNIGWAVGDGLIVGTTDGGKTWNTQRNGNPNERLFGIGCASPQRAWAAGPDGLLLRTSDAGKTWSRQEIDPKYALVRVRFFGEDGWILGDVAGHGLLLRTNDGGSTWRPQAIDTSESLFDIYMNGKQGWVVGSNGTISRSTDRGQSWQKQQSPTTNDLACLFFLSPNEGWAGGAKRTLLRFRN
jgi:photosystem II stability/assembly factor-like uncharacterized protein